MLYGPIAYARSRAAARRYRNAVLVDWRGASSGLSKTFAKDGIHLISDGARAYARVIAAAVR